jgi:hypothetical protein
VTASTLRRPDVGADKKRSGTPENIASLVCTPLDPLRDPDLFERFGTQASSELLVTYVQGGLDIIPGDILVVSGTEYPIRAVGDWTWRPSATDYQQLIIEEIKS